MKSALKRLALGSIAITVAFSDRATAADMSAKAPVPYLSWTGFYFGGHFDYGAGSFGAGTNPVLSQAAIFPSTPTGFIGGYQAGYNWQLSNKIIVGVEADLSFISPIDRPATGLAPFNTTLDYFGTARSRVGYVFGRLFPYVTGGVAWGRTRVVTNGGDGGVLSVNHSNHIGWTAGAGVEFPVAGNWTGKVEYNYLDFGSKTFELNAAGPPGSEVDPKFHLIKLGLNYRLGDIPPLMQSAAPVKSSIAEDDSWSIHGQTTFIQQGYPRFRSPYESANSLPGGGQGRETLTTTAFLGWRLWDGGEVYFNPELAQGFGLAGTLGLGGFSNGEAQKAGAEFPKIRAQRYFLRQTIGLGGEQEAVPDGLNQVAGKRDVDRITLTIGRIAIGDIFDNNTYAHDPRADFMNWAMWSSVAYDFPADLPGFTRGVVAELNRKDWAVRAGLFQVPDGPNSDVLTFKTGGAIVEFELRYNIFDQPGKLRLGAFADRGRSGNYNEALSIALSTPDDINAAMASIRQLRPKYGLYVNAEQAINKDVGLFLRASWNDGQNEILSFTDVDRSLSGGVAIKGSGWGRPNDTIGIGGAINGLSAPHRNFLAAGGLGLLIGDGQLNYSREKIIEAYYAINLAKWATLTFDYQFVANPAYNSDRGPVSIFATRLHSEF